MIAVVILGNINDDFLGYPNKITVNFSSKKSFISAFIVHKPILEKNSFVAPSLIPSEVGIKLVIAIAKCQRAKILLIHARC